MQTDNELNQSLDERIENLQEITLNRLHRTLNVVRRLARQANLPMEGYDRFKRQYQSEIEDMDRQLNDLKNDTTSDLETRNNSIGRLERQAVDLEENIFRIPSRLDDTYQPEEEPEPNEEEEEEETSEQSGGRKRKHRKTKHRKTGHKGGKRKQKTRRNKHKRTKRNKH